MHKDRDITQRQNLKLSEALTLCQRELAQVRESQESLLEQRSRLQRDCNAAVVSEQQLAQALASHLTKSFWEARQPPTPIGWRRFVGSRWPKLKRTFGKRQSAIETAEQISIRQIEQCALFDAAWYLRRNLDVAAAGLHPAAHFLRVGAAEGRDPGPKFSVATYMAKHPGLAEQGINPLLHHLLSVTS